MKDGLSCRGTPIPQLLTRSFAGTAYDRTDLAWERIGNRLTTANALARIQSEFSESPEVRHLVAFTQASERGLAKHLVIGPQPHRGVLRQLRATP